MCKHTKIKSYQQFKNEEQDTTFYTFDDKRNRQYANATSPMTVPKNKYHIIFSFEIPKNKQILPTLIKKNFVCMLVQKFIIY